MKKPYHDAQQGQPELKKNSIEVQVRTWFKTYNTG
jgi:hypothetical protein